MEKVNGYIILEEQSVIDTSYFNTTYLDGGITRVSYTSSGASNNMTFEEYKKIHSDKLIVISCEEYEFRLKQSVLEQKKQFKEIDKASFDDMFNILPPQSWGTILGVEFFYVLERIDMNLVYWYGSIDGRYFRFVDEATAKKNDIVDRFKKLAEL
ncbi:hypothetical protein [Pseudoalteromonas sp. SR41-6]|uniref:hypothetical protein n=1 Tax=Pseudoalteromonas sp. SR41-6 TaxID=2760948 RepID=UPI001601D29B|nr:hypothetical protein [Pseudoalteromonas sp. SR41-6]MBB1333984.1 hypothetical protein [Pseudoalteromonas sp. SR41-6]